MKILGTIVYGTAYRISFLVAKWRLAWSMWNNAGNPNGVIRWPD